VGVYIEEDVHTCAPDTPVKTFTYPGTERKICFFNKSFRQVKHLPAISEIWFKGNDNLEGKTVVGVEGTLSE
jgi:hypothetical protein